MDDRPGIGVLPATSITAATGLRVCLDHRLTSTCMATEEQFREHDSRSRPTPFGEKGSMLPLVFGLDRYDIRNSAIFFSVGIKLPNSLIDELQLGASNATAPVPSLLRTALIVAAKLGVSDIPEWINKELSGYENGNSVPNYRIVYGEVRARDPFQGWLPVKFPNNDFEESASRCHLTESIAEIEALGKRKGALVRSFPAELQHLLQTMYQRNTQFLCFVEQSRFERVLDEVRNQVLRWAIALDRAGVRGDGLSFSNAEKEKAHSLTFHACNGTVNIGVIGNVTGQPNVATGYNPRAGSILLEDIRELAAEITKHIPHLALSGIENEELRSMLTELQADKSVEPSTVRKVLNRILALSSKGGETIVTVGTKAFVESWMKAHGITS